MHCFPCLDAVAFAASGSGKTWVLHRDLARERTDKKHGSSFDLSRLADLLDAVMLKGMIIRIVVAFSPFISQFVS